MTTISNEEFLAKFKELAKKHPMTAEQKQLARQHADIIKQHAKPMTAEQKIKYKEMLSQSKLFKKNTTTE